jgi:hypothetical protein
MPIVGDEDYDTPFPTGSRGERGAAETIAKPPSVLFIGKPTASVGDGEGDFDLQLDVFGTACEPSLTDLPQGLSQPSSSAYMASAAAAIERRRQARSQLQADVSQL